MNHRKPVARTPRENVAPARGRHSVGPASPKSPIKIGLALCALLGLAVAIPSGLAAAARSTSFARSSTPVIAEDGFARTVRPGLGAADIGGTYGVSAGPGTPISVSGGSARITGLAAGGSTLAWLPGAVASDSQVQISLTVPATGRVPAGLYSAVDLRRQSNGNVYRAKLKVDAGGVLGLRLARVLGGSEVTLAAKTLPITLTAGRTITISAQVLGSNPVALSARAWLTGDPTPDWQLIAKDSASNALTRQGSVGFWNYLGGGSSPATFTESAFRAVSLDGRTGTTTPSGTASTSAAPSSTSSSAAPSTSASSSAAPTTQPASSTATATPTLTPTPSPTSPAPSAGARGSAAVGTADYAPPADAIYVADSNGSNSASGSRTAPLKTIAAAISKAVSGQTIVVRGGTYHESLTVPATRTNLTIQAYPNEAVWLDGSSVVTGWTQSGTKWVHSGWTKRLDHSASFATGTNNPDFVNSAYPMAAWPDQVFLAGQQLQQVSSASQVVAGKFAVDYAAQTITIGSNPSGKEVRSSDLEQAVYVLAPGVTLQGFGVHRYGTPLPLLGTIRMAGGNDLARDLVISDNATQGLSFRNSGNKADHVSSVDNGMTGIHGNNADHLTITNSVVSGNNSEHFNESPSSGGIKVTRSRTVAVTNSDLSANLSKGIWLDESVVGFTIANNKLVGNSTGITTELSDTGIIANNSVDGGSRGLWIFDTGNVKVFNNYFVNNPIGAVFLNQDQRREANPSAVGHDPRQPIPDPTCPWLTRNITVDNNVIGRSAGSSMFQFYALDKATRISADQMNLTLDGNLFTYHATNSDPTMVGWGGSDNVTVIKYQTPAALNQGEGKTWHNMQTSAGVQTLSATSTTAAADSANAVPLPADVASVIGVPTGTKRIGTF
jgi:hypothetical protein